MKRMALSGWLLALGMIVGCQGEAATEPDAGAVEPPSVTIPDETGAGQIESAGDTEVDEAGGESGASLDAETSVPVAVNEPSGADEVADTEDAGDAEDPAEPSEEERMGQLIAAMSAAIQGGDIAKAIEMVNAAIEELPQRVELKINRMILQSQYAESLESGDKAKAAEELIKAGEYATAVEDAVQQLPEAQRGALQQFLANSLYQQTRGYAYQGKQEEALAALEKAGDAGLTSFGDLEDDELLAPLRDNEKFREKLAELKEKAEEVERRLVAQEFAEQESFEFGFSLPNLDQETVALADFAGKFVIVDFWGTWCPPCRREIPFFVKLQEKYADDLAVVGITYENDEDEELARKRVQEFAEEQGINYPLVMGDTETRAKVPNFRGFPTTLFLDRTGKVRLMIVGLHPYEKLEMYLKHLIAEGNASEQSAG